MTRKWSRKQDINQHNQSNEIIPTQKVRQTFLRISHVKRKPAMMIMLDSTDNNSSDLNIYYHPNPDNFSAHCDQKVDPSLYGQLYCPPVYDSVICWPATHANSTVYKVCNDDPWAMAHRECSANGTWKGYTNYTICVAVIKNSQTTEAIMPNDSEISIQSAEALMMVYFIGSLVSLVVLLVSLFIFIKFKSLQCPRTSIHKHLIVSFILRFITIIVLLEPYVFQHEKWYREMEWMCRILISLQNFAMVSNFCWMLVEGFFLHLILVLRPLNNDKTPFAFFYSVGWVLPLIVTSSWAAVMHFKHDVSCWNDSTKSPYIFIIYAPIMLVLLINLIILFNLIRIVIVKLCTGHTTERRKICRTIKSTVFLVFLLGVINLLFFFRPPDETNARLAYRYVNAVLPPCQGIFVSLLYCVMNAEVRRVIKKKWLRFREIRHFSNSMYRRRSSRTSMTMFVTSEVPRCSVAPDQNNGNCTEHAPMMELTKLQQNSDKNHEKSNFL